MLLSNPYALFWLLLALPLAALFLLKVRPRLQAVSTVLFWQQVLPDSRPRRWWQRLRHPLSLLLQLLLLLLLTLALAQPQWRPPPPPRLLLVILDNSASMQATDAVPDRLSVARQRVAQLIDGLGPQDQMALISAGTSASLRCGVTAHKRSLRRALDDIPPTDGPGQLGKAIELARRLPGDDAARQLVVLTDPGGRNAAEAHGAPSGVRWIVSGQLADNVAITQFQVRRQALDPIGYECLIEVASFAAAELHCRLSIELSGELQDVIPLDLLPQQRRLQVLPYVSAAGGLLTARLDVADCLPADNQAVAWVTPRQPRRITLATAGNRYLEKALMAMPLVDLEVSASVPAEPDPTRVLIVQGLPIDRLPAGRSMVVQPIQSNPWWQLGAALPDAVIGRQHTASPLLAHLHVEDLPVRGTRVMRLPDQADVLAATLENQPVYAIVPHDQGETLVLNVDLQAGDFAWRTAFPLLMSNAVNWLVRQTATFQATYATGDVVHLDELSDAMRQVPYGLSSPASLGSAGPVDWQVESPRGDVRRFSQQGLRQPLGPLDQAGVWTLRPVASSADSEVRVQPPVLRVACNVVDPQESDLRVGRTESTALAALGRVGQPPWFYLVAAALCLLALEWWLYQRRWIG